MEQPNQGIDPNNSSSVSGKRKRGRPRKDARPNFSPGGNAHGTPPGFQATNGNLPHGVGHQNDNANGIMMGQAIQGVIEATFDAGYVLTVKLGNTGITMRGVVFKPGHYVPVGPYNDVAPDVPMVQRNKIPVPAPNHTGQRRSEPHVNSQTNRSANLVQVPPPASNGQQHGVVGQTNLSSNFVPVVLQPVNLSNGGPTSHSAPGTSAGTVKSTGLPFNNLLSEVVLQSSADTDYEISESASDSTEEEEEDDDEDEDQVLSIEPLQAVQPDHQYPASSMSKHLESYGTGKMTELLQAVQKTMKENN